MKAFLSDLRFMIRDAWQSRREARKVDDGGFYRDSSDIYGRGLGGASAERIRRHTEDGIRPDHD